MVVPFQEIIDRELFKTILIAISQFRCKDMDVETFLKNKAIDFERRNKSRTYLIIDDINNSLLGYFTLSLKALRFNSSVSKKTIKSIDGFSKEVKAVGITLIGQFGKDTVLAREIDGGKLFDMCLETVFKVQKIVGGRFVMLECLDIKEIVSFYKKQGFETLQFNESDKYLQMVRQLS
ncbi:MAG: hypothetical protein FWG42_04560 [Clostridiales bacterium]|nr:hypothetical protein [Clostridiales bacterium]